MATTPSPSGGAAIGGGVGGGGGGGGTTDFSLLRQHVIVYLLEKVSMKPEALYTTCRKFLHSGVLTHEFLPEFLLYSFST